MRRILSVFVACLTLAAAGTALAEDVPSVMTSQGVVRNEAGDVVNGVYALNFKLYNQQNGGQLLWSEVKNNLAVENGVYSTVLGTVNPLPAALFEQNDSVWLAISIEGEDDLPRVRVTSVPYAFEARHAMVAGEANGLDCTGCIDEAALGFDPVTADDLANGDLVVNGSVTAATFIGDGSGLTGITSPQGECAPGWFISAIGADGELLCQEGASLVDSVDGLAGGTITGDVEVSGGLTVNGAEVCTEDANCGESLAQLACDANQVAMWNGDMWTCSDFLTEFDPSALPADGLDEVSNNLLFNQFVDIYSSATTPVPISDNNPIGVSDEIDVPDAGLAQDLTVSINITNSDLSTVRVVLFDPDNVEYVLYDKGGPGNELGATYPTPVEPVSGDLTSWIDKNPQGVWRLQVFDTGWLNNEFDGQINSWSIQVKTLSSKKVHLKGDLVIDGTITGPDGMYLPGNPTVEGSIKIGSDDAACDGDKEGSIRYSGSELEWCDGASWNPIRRRATYRWATWSTYGQAHGQWYAGNNSDMFGGVHPSHWGNSNARAYQISSNSDLLRTMFVRRGPTIGTLKNATVFANEWYSYSSTNSRHVATLFRIRNNTDQAINWVPHWYRTGYGGWEERASIALNGDEVWQSSGNFGAHDNSSHSISIPPNRTSTVIFVASSSSESGTRSCFMAFYNNSLVLPAGLEFVDDLDTKPNGWDN